MGTITFLLAICVFSAYIIGYGSYDYQGALLMAPVVAIMALLLLPRMESKDKFILNLLILGLGLKTASAMLRLYMNFGYYSDGFAGGLGAEITGGFDAGRYNRVGSQIAELFRTGYMDAAISHFRPGTSFVEFFTGLVYTITGPTLFGGFLAFSFLAFLGSFFAYRAFRIAFPDANYRLYAVLVFLFPTLLYWPNGIGKDSLVMFGIGLTSYGAAWLITKGKLSSILPLAVGMLFVWLVRPHIAGILGIALAAALLVRGFRGTKTSPVYAILWPVIAISVGWLFFNQAVGFIGLEDASFESAIAFIDSRSQSTFAGGSAFESPSLSEPLGVPMAIVTGFFRPFPWEANNFLALVESLAGISLAVLIAWQFGSLVKGAGAVLSNPYITFVLIFTIGTLLALTAISNFGLLGRQRTMFLPLFFMLLAMKPARQPD